MRSPSHLIKDKNDDLDPKGPLQLENWVDFIRRTPSIATEHLEKAQLEDCVASEGDTKDGQGI